jgi:hypothetical protein
MHLQIQKVALDVVTCLDSILRGQGVGATVHDHVVDHFLWGFILNPEGERERQRESQS